MKDSSDCPGRFKCHGPASWCDACGDVDLICDDPACDAHKRGSERLLEWSQAEYELREAEAEFRSKQKAEREAWQSYQRWTTGNPVMVGRKEPAECTKQQP